MTRVYHAHILRWLLFGIVGLMIGGGVWLYGMYKHRQELSMLVRRAVEDEAALLFQHLNARLEFFARQLLDLYQTVPPQSQVEYERLTDLLVQTHPFLQTINYIDPTRHIRFVSPFESNQQIVGLAIELPAPKHALETARAFERPYLSEPFEIIQGEVGYSLMIPSLDGAFFEIVFTGRNVFGATSTFRRRQDIVIQIIDGALSVPHSEEYEVQFARFHQYEVVQDVSLLNREMQLRALPTERLVTQAPQGWRTVATLLVPITGGFLMVIIVMQAWYLQKYQHMREAVQQSEEASRRERDLIARITDVSPVGVTMVNQEGQISFANTRAEEVLGLTKSDITHRAYNAPEWHITDYEGNPFPEDRLPFARVMHTGQPVFDMRHAIEWPDGRRVLLSINAAPLFDEHDQVDSMVATVEDVTEKVRVEEEIRRTKDQLQSIFRAAPIGMGVVTNRIFTFVNQRIVEMLGYSGAELLGHSARMIYPTEEEFRGLGL